MKLQSRRIKFVTSCIISCIIYSVFIVIITLVVYGFVQLCTHSNRFTLIEAQRSKIASLETKIIFLENNDWSLIIESMPEMERNELKLRNEQIKQKKYKENNK